MKHSYGSQNDEEAGLVRRVVAPPPPRSKHAVRKSKRVLVGTSIALLGAGAACAYVAMNSSVSRSATPSVPTVNAAAALANDLQSDFADLDTDGDGIVTKYEVLQKVTSQRDAVLAKIATSDLDESLKASLQAVETSNFDDQIKCISDIFDRSGETGVDSDGFAFVAPVLKTMCNPNSKAEAEVHEATIGGDIAAPDPTTISPTIDGEAPTDAPGEDPTTTSPATDQPEVAASSTDSPTSSTDGPTDAPNDDYETDASIPSTNILTVATDAPNDDEDATGAPDVPSTSAEVSTTDQPTSAPSDDAEATDTPTEQPTATRNDDDTDATEQPTETPNDDETDVTEMPTEQPTTAPNDDDADETDAPSPSPEAPTDTSTDDDADATEPPTAAPATSTEQPTDALDDDTDADTTDAPTSPTDQPTSAPSDDDADVTDSPTVATGTPTSSTESPTTSTDEPTGNNDDTLDVTDLPAASTEAPALSAPDVSAPDVTTTTTSSSSESAVDRIKKELKALDTQSSEDTQNDVLPAIQNQFLDDSVKSPERVDFEKTLNDHFQGELKEHTNDLAFAKLESTKQSYMLELLDSCVTSAGRRFEHDRTFVGDVAVEWIKEKCLHLPSPMVHDNH